MVSPEAAGLSQPALDPGGVASMAPGYLNPSTLVAVKYMATEALRWRRPRRAARVRSYVVHPAGDLAPLAMAVYRYLKAI